jgi:ubiquinone/menaquinone biosynthesis C-methylase UbiE
MANRLDTDHAVEQRYSAAAEQREAALCCPVDYDRHYLEIIPQEVIERDYGCGDPSKYLHPGETVLDLGSGGGKICFIAAQVVGPRGRVIGVDMNETMLDLARRSQAEVVAKLGFDNLQFFKGRIQDLAIDRDRVDAFLAENPVDNEESLRGLERYLSQMRREFPMIEDDSIDVVVSNCVLNLVDAAEKEQLFREIFRVLKPGGRAVISDIVSDEPVPPHLQNDAELWSGCISGALQEAEFLRAFERAGFYGIEMPMLQQQPWQTVEGIEFRSATVLAYKGKEGPCDDYQEAMIYRGPFSQVSDDDGHVFRRGVRTAVCRKTFQILSKAPYAQSFFPVPPHQAVSDADAKPMTCGGQIRSPRVTKGKNYKLTVVDESCCAPGECC